MSGLREITPLTRRQELFLGDLCKARSLAEAAKAAHVSEATARRWLALPPVQDAYRDMRRQLVESAMTGLQAASRAAVAALVRNLAPDVPATVQVRAAATILTFATQAVEVADVLARLDELEQRVAEQQEQQQQAQPFGRSGVAAGRMGCHHG
jgi:hypothetical protein